MMSHYCFSIVFLRRLFCFPKENIKVSWGRQSLYERRLRSSSSYTDYSTLFMGTDEIKRKTPGGRFSRLAVKRLTCRFFNVKSIQTLQLSKQMTIAVECWFPSDRQIETWNGWMAAIEKWFCWFIFKSNQTTQHPPEAAIISVWLMPWDGAVINRTSHNVMVVVCRWRFTVATRRHHHQVIVVINLFITD